MTFTQEWVRRVDHWERVLFEAVYRRLGELELTGFITTEQLSFDEALRRPFEPAPVGMAWGAKWEYGWFRADCALPPEAQNQRVVMKLDLGIERLVWINGKVAGSGGWGHTHTLLTRQGRAGERFEVVCEAYAGHGPMEVGGGPVRFGAEAFADCPEQQGKVGVCEFGVWDEEIYQAALDFSALNSLLKKLDPNSLRCSRVERALMDATLVIDLELPYAEAIETVRRGRETLRPALECVNGSTAPEFFAIGNGHLDVAWLWPLAETERKIARTLVEQLNLMEDYPEYQFLQSQPHLFRMLRQRYPELYERVRAAVRRGQMVADGGMWVEADTNLSGGEALVRQLLHGLRFFKEELGVDSTILWLPDVFGYSGALPQILRGAGMKGFATQKIVWAYNGGDPFPYNTFLWEGIDGTTLPAHIFLDYGVFPKPEAVVDRWNTHAQKSDISKQLLAYGWGDGGGGPTRDHVEYVRRLRDLEGAPRVRPGTLAEFFAAVEQDGELRQRYTGELYFQAHRGTYTSQARTKAGNRRGELALREAELWGCAARALAGFDFSNRTLDEDWKALLLNQFHDIIPGSSIQRVYQEAEAAYAALLENAGKVAEGAASSLLRPDDAALTVFNPLSWERRVTVALPWNGAVIEAIAPACGWVTLTPDTLPAQPAGEVFAQAGAQPRLENDLVRVLFNEFGEIVSLWDKEAGRELAAGPCNRFALYKDAPVWFDAWDIDSNYVEMPVPLTEPGQLEVVEQNACQASLRLTRRLANSTLTQTITLRRGSRRIDFDTQVDWREKHRLLKVCFPVDVHANEAIHEIQFGHLRRPNHKSRPFDADRFEVSNHKWTALAQQDRGAAVLNDCKYGVNVDGNSINLTLLKSALAPDKFADQGEQRFKYALYCWKGSLAESGVVQAAYELNAPARIVPGAARAPQASLISVSDPAVVVEAVKPAEDGSGDVVVRLYESLQTSPAVTLRLGLPVRAAVETNLLEEPLQNLTIEGGSLALRFRPFEIKTVRLKL